MRAIVALFIFTAALMPFTGACDDMSQRGRTPDDVRCEEDMPCWDCTTMGNRICGPITAEEAP